MCEKVCNVQVRSLQQAKHCPSIASTDPQPVVQHGDIQPGWKALLDFSQPLKPLSAWKGWAHPSTASEANLHSVSFLSCDIGLNADSGQATKKSAQFQQIASTTVFDVKNLQIVQPGSLFQPGRNRLRSRSDRRRFQCRGGLRCPRDSSHRRSVRQRHR